MATLIVATLEQHSATLWRLRWTSAGHLPPLLVSATGGDCYLAHGEEHGTMLGVDPSPRRVHQHRRGGHTGNTGTSHAITASTTLPDDWASVVVV
ncbi:MULTISPECIES: hypothetical protein [unclassified Streptomyces]|uniref:hypothetical protein n=1 Tax=unclassified Streptomyces TaxID=2593676 RepID=UPI002DDB5C19|nr:hypothetical protein [Streptomyces sp. NBC_01750]WSB04641.1 serine/threonine-protein phosphatase [Streptomyces sp. NBC_01794]WSD31077.1 serine/threonine-protein phosphatase [Streptomyces sp. NBC_01750]